MGQLVVLATGVLLTPIIVHSVGAASFGLWVLANSLAGFGGVLDLGISSTVQKYVAEHRARGTTEELSGVVSTALALYGCLGLLAFGVFVGLAPVIPEILGIRGENRQTATWLIMLLGFQLAIALPAATPSAVLRGAQRYDLANFLVIAATLTSAALTVFVLALGAGIVAVAAVSAAVPLGMVLPAVLLVRRAVPGVSLQAAAVSRRRARTVLSFSTSIFGVRIADVLKRRSDPIVIATALPVGRITPFALAQRLSEAVALLTNQFVQVLLPLASELDAREDRRALQAVYLAATRVALGISFALAATVGLLGSSILHVWIGAEYSRYGYLVAILAAAAVVDTVAWPAAAVLTGIGRHRPLAWMALGGAAAKVALALIAVVPFGLTGVAMATLIAAGAETALLAIPYALRTVELRASTFAAKVIVPNLVPAAAILLLLLIARTLLDTDRLGILLGAISVALAAYAAAYFSFSAGVVEKRFYRHLGASSWSALTRTARN